eukprot:SAG31_NODE_44_length_31168_cov_16.507290_3_plen_77_part_00
MIALGPHMCLIVDCHGDDETLLWSRAELVARVEQAKGAVAAAAELAKRTKVSSDPATIMLDSWATKFQNDHGGSVA